MNFSRVGYIFLTSWGLMWGGSLDFGAAQTFESNSRLILGSEANRSASIRIGDLDADGDLDVVVANGRHWPDQNYVFLNQGRARFNVMRPLGSDRSTTYACELADFDGDGDLDIATGNDMAPCQIFLNDGDAQFSLQGSFGDVSSVRSLTVADIDLDGDQDILVTCRGRSNRIYLNDGSAKFDQSIEFGTKRDSTIDVEVGDVDGDGDLDLVLANRDGQPNAWLINDGKLNFDQTRTFGHAQSQTRAVAVGDFDGNGILDWAIGNIGQSNQLFLGDGKGGVAKAIDFGEVDSKTYCLAAFDMDRDGDLDLIAGNAGQANAVYLNEGRGQSFREVVFGDPLHLTYGLSVGDLDSDGTPDIALANSDAPNQVFLGRLDRRNISASGMLEDKERAMPSGSADFRERAEYRTHDWPAFRGLGGRGVAEGFSLPVDWNADPEAGDLKNVLWQIQIPGLGHSSPVVVEDKVFLLTAVSQSKLGDSPRLPTITKRRTGCCFAMTKRRGGNFGGKHFARANLARHATPKRLTQTPVFVFQVKK